ncbi:hypothetical protein [Actinophytocola xanthii]|uniref:Uncharacterized protein n=1 Tax=Actinophytocola xanthii TaxID=1912961 RepID=A0A1Q8CXT0_9PSEU|nr:hypothetical protein [Actinophytocola xanthii]OLF19166.1 hypothetical protein BU204_02005 [Actinophytocola xanthii]
MTMGTDGEPARRRRALRRIAWSLFVGGLVVACLMVGTGLLLLAGGEDVGPGHPPGLWPAGVRASVHKPFGVGEAQRCEALSTDGTSNYTSLDWATSVRAANDVTVRCPQEAIFLTGTASAAASAVHSPLIMVPVAAALVGLVLFFPRPR